MIPFAYLSLLCLADPHTDSIWINRSEFGASVAKVTQSWVGGETMTNTSETWGNLGVKSGVQGGSFPLVSYCRAWSCRVGRTGWGPASPEMRGFCPCSRVLLTRALSPSPWDEEDCLVRLSVCWSKNMNCSPESSLSSSVRCRKGSLVNVKHTYTRV